MFKMEEQEKLEKIVEKVWGRELWIVNTDRYCGKILEVKTGYRCSMHYHKKKDETFHIASGKILMEVDGKPRIMEAGDTQRIMPGVKHRFTGLAEDCEDDYSEIYEFSTHHEESDSYREEISGKVDLNELQLEVGIAFR